MVNPFSAMISYDRFLSNTIPEDFFPKLQFLTWQMPKTCGNTQIEGHNLFLHLLILPLLYLVQSELFMLSANLPKNNLLQSLEKDHTLFLQFPGELTFTMCTQCATTPTHTHPPLHTYPPHTQEKGSVPMFCFKVYPA